MNSLFLALEMSGDRVDLGLLRQRLPPQNREGYSMLDLREAASALGYPCRGITISAGEGPPDRPAIALMGNAAHGHFLIIRPLDGTDNSRVQVVDPPSSPIIVDWARLTSDPHWTGRLLVRTSIAERLLPYGMPCVLLLLSLLLGPKPTKARILHIIGVLHARLTLRSKCAAGKFGTSATP